jgi:hypothetical protein
MRGALHRKSAIVKRLELKQFATAKDLNEDLKWRLPGQDLK